jgi:hypothetical protein
MSKGDENETPTLAVLPSFQELQWDGKMGQHDWPDRVWAAASAPNLEALPQSAKDQARTAEAAKIAASTLSVPAVLPVPRPALTKSAIAASSSKERVAQWFEQWSRAGSMGMFGAVPAPFKTFYPLKNPDQPVELDPDVEACILHYLAWEAANNVKK